MTGCLINVSVVPENIQIFWLPWVLGDRSGEVGVERQVVFVNVVTPTGIAAMQPFMPGGRRIGRGAGRTGMCGAQLWR
ncbi:hypothetical protein [Burkholderia sp. TSV86]|uniref:hypothetical protein n=1 Tax=Burkholderia sp. TSV86 TaxID=1385594 RepID=UPI0012E36749|nr:hypothetical protein [Burkholderia sp. TSV86]